MENVILWCVTAAMVGICIVAIGIIRTLRQMSETLKEMAGVYDRVANQYKDEAVAQQMPDPVERRHVLRSRKD